MARVLIVEDEVSLSKSVKRMLEKLGHAVTVAASIADGEAAFGAVDPDLVLLDLRLPDGDGLELLSRLVAQDPSVQVLVMTAYAAVDDAVRALKLGAKDYLQKPLAMDDLKHAVARILDEMRLQQEVHYYRSRESQGTGFGALLGTSAPLAELRARLERLCNLPPDASPPTVLITGETGTGKGLVARMLHYNGRRASQPFIEVNCAAIPENLVEAELFGYERGAFTDAKTSKVGLFQAADQGTLFLDEIGCLPLAVQVKILKAIEEKEIRPVGGRTARRVDTQIVAATNSDLQREVRAGTFREDLFYRLRVAPLVVPPLRERGDDILLLAHTFADELVCRYRLAPKTFTPEAERMLRTYHWPGNVRELRNTLDRALLFADGTSIEAAGLGLPRNGRASAAPTVDTSRPGGLAIEIPDGGIRFDDVERAMIVGALRKAGGNQREAARLLGLTRDTLRYRMEKFGITSKG
jgi:DNA-binding NtrC family response regulator